MIPIWNNALHLGTLMGKFDMKSELYRDIQDLIQREIFNL